MLLSAFACSPKLGSEDGIGWRWAIESSRLGYSVDVITRTSYRLDIEAAIAQIAPGQTTPKFYYVDLLPNVGYEGIGKLIGYVYIYVWQVQALLLARKLCAANAYRFIHHITFGTIRFPSFLGLLAVPLVYGPAGGGESCPVSLRRGYSLRGKVLERIRDLSNYLVTVDPLANLSFSTVTLLFLRTKENVRFIPRRTLSKVRYAREVAIDLPNISSRELHSRPLRVLYLGRFLYWKGMHIGLAAFSAFAQKHPGARLTMVGRGPDEAHWRRLAQQFGLTPHVDWIPWMDRSRLPELYAGHDILLFPSLHDAGANVVYEGASYGLPTLCLDLGAPGEIVDQRNGRVVITRGRSEQEVAAELACFLEELDSDRQALQALSSTSREWAEQQSWPIRVGEFYAEVEQALGQSRDAVSQ